MKDVSAAEASFVSMAKEADQVPSENTHLKAIYNSRLKKCQDRLNAMEAVMEAVLQQQEQHVSAGGGLGGTTTEQPDEEG